MQQITKEYKQPFVLEPTKLTRLIDKIHERLKDHKNAILRDKFEVYLTADHRKEMTKLDQVLALDNSRKRKITRLVATCFASMAGADHSEHEVQVDFAHPKGAGSNITKIVVVNVRSDTDGWADRTLSEVEEQIERTWQRHFPPTMVLFALLVTVLLGTIGVLLPQVIRFDDSGRRASQWMWLERSDVKRIEAMLLQPQHTLTDDELREVGTMELRNLVEASKPPPDSNFNTRLVYFVVIPSGVLAGCVIALLALCYPTAVFLWGDGVGRYDDVSQRRKILWGIIIAVFIGITSKLLYDGFSTWVIPHK